MQLREAKEQMEVNMDQEEGDHHPLKAGMPDRQGNALIWNASKKKQKESVTLSEHREEEN